jgi:diadenosine tetraphosphatase ApaH/serine/threonine PP2A family protein phosphatase
VLDHINRQGFQNRFCLGDLVGYGVFPNEVVERIRSEEIPTIMGNYDHGVGNDSDDCGCAYRDKISEELGMRSIAWSNAHTIPENKAFLRSLVPQIPVQLGNLKVLLVHGSPRKINEYLFEDRPDASLERLMDSAGVDVLVCGHTHLPYHRILPSGRQVINAGSVGKPKDGDPRACYLTLLVVDGQLISHFHRVEYDVDKATAAIQHT